MIIYAYQHHVRLLSPEPVVVTQPQSTRVEEPTLLCNQSDRREVSDRTMVGTAQPLCLFASGTEGRRYESTMNLGRRKNHRVSSHYLGWTARPFHPCLTVVGEVFLLTSLFIERRYR